jgi:multidrug efflux pump subunit AcrA (membrane-fusion protein)
MKQVITRPYEFLVRWRDGVISGAHVGFEDVIVEDGAVIGAVQQNVQAVDIGLGKGFPLAEILGQIHIDALTERDAAIAERDAQIAEREAAEIAKDAAIAEKQALIAQAETQAAELQELRQLKEATKGGDLEQKTV